MYITESKTLNVTVTGSQKTPIWKSDNTAIVTVNSKGTISAKKAGTAIITVTVDGVKKIIQQDLWFGRHVPNIQIYKNRKNIEFWWSYGHNFYTYRNGVLSKKVSASCSSPQRYGDPWYVNKKVVSIL